MLNLILFNLKVLKKQCKLLNKKTNEFFFFKTFNIRKKFNIENKQIDFILLLLMIKHKKNNITLCFYLFLKKIITKPFLLIS